MVTPAPWVYVWSIHVWLCTRGRMGRSDREQIKGLLKCGNEGDERCCRACGTEVRGRQLSVNDAHLALGRPPCSLNYSNRAPKCLLTFITKHANLTICVLVSFLFCLFQYNKWSGSTSHSTTHAHLHDKWCNSMQYFWIYLYLYICRFLTHMHATMNKVSLIKLI